jgi:S-adenosylmethionine synthetase
MPTSFMQTPQFFFTSESVTEGHPDKLCDQISDAILDAFLEKDPRARVACETAATTGLVLVMGEVTTSAYVEIQEVVRRTIREIGYTGIGSGFDADTCGVIVSLHGQSPDIAMGVDKALEAKRGELTEAEIESVGAGDQGMMIGFACDETEELMPMPIAVAHRLAKRLADVRKAGVVPYLRPDGKSQVTIEYLDGKPVAVNTVLISAQHREEVDVETLLAPDIREHVIDPVLAEVGLEHEGRRILVNPTGRFEIGGPKADTGLTGRKIMVDSYGAMAPHGGGCFSGKDPTKVDRSAAYMGRYVAKNIVAAGLAGRVQLQVAYAIGTAHPVSLAIDTFRTSHVDPVKLESVVREAFDFRPAAIIRDLDLRRPIYRETAAYGHFGRKGFPWEETDRAEDLRRAFD